MQVCTILGRRRPAPASILPVMPGEHVLDLCAAPGGKATALGAAHRVRLLVANKYRPSRAEGTAQESGDFRYSEFLCHEPYPAKREQFAGAKILTSKSDGPIVLRKVCSGRIWRMPEYGVWKR